MCIKQLEWLRDMNRNRHQKDAATENVLDQYDNYKCFKNILRCSTEDKFHPEVSRTRTETAE